MIELMRKTVKTAAGDVTLVLYLYEGVYLTWRAEYKAVGTGKEVTVARQIEVHDLGSYANGRQIVERVYENLHKCLGVEAFRVVD